ncbi:MAG: FtsX-like permease family protein [Candidatus Hodarchaeales archaeon]
MQDDDSAIFMSIDISSDVNYNNDTEFVVETYNNQKNIHSRMVETLSITEMREFSLSYFTFEVFDEFNQRIIVISGFFENNLSYFSPALVHSNDFDEGYAYGVYYLQQDNDTLALGTEITLNDNNTFIRITNTVDSRKTGKISLFQRNDSYKNASFLICSAETALSVLEEVLLYDDRTVLKSEVNLIQILDYSGKETVSTVSELQETIWKIANYIELIKSTNPDFQGWINTSALKTDYENVILQLVAILVIPLYLVLLYLIFFIDKSLYKEFCEDYKLLRIRGFQLMESLAFLTVHNLIISVVGCLVGFLVGLLLFTLEMGMIIDFSAYQTYFQQDFAAMISRSLSLGVLIFISTTYSELKSFKLLADNDFRRTSNRYKEDGFVAKNKLDVISVFLGILILIVVQEFSPGNQIASGSTLESMYELITILKTVSFYLILIGSFFIVSRGYRYYLQFLTILSEKTGFKKLWITTKYSMRNFYLTKLVFIVLIISLFFLTFSLSARSTTEFNLDRQALYNTGSSFSIENPSSWIDGLILSYCSQNNLPTNKVVKITCPLSGVFFGIDPDNYLKTDFFSKENWYSDSLESCLAALETNNSILISNFAKVEHHATMNSTIGFPDIISRSSETEGTFKVRGFFKFWPNLVLEDQLPDHQNAERGYYYIINIDKLYGLIEDEYIPGEVKEYRYVKTTSIKQERELAAYLDQNFIDYSSSTSTSGTIWALMIRTYDFFSYMSWTSFLIIFITFMLSLFRERKKQIAINRILGARIRTIVQIFLQEICFTYLGIFSIALLILYPLLISFGTIFPYSGAIPYPVIMIPFIDITLVFLVNLLSIVFISVIISRKILSLDMSTLLKVE